MKKCCNCFLVPWEKTSCVNSSMVIQTCNLLQLGILPNKQQISFISSYKFNFGQSISSIPFTPLSAISQSIASMSVTSAFICNYPINILYVIHFFILQYPINNVYSPRSLSLPLMNIHNQGIEIINIHSMWQVSYICMMQIYVRYRAKMLCIQQ